MANSTLSAARVEISGGGVVPVVRHQGAGVAPRRREKRMATLSAVDIRVYFSSDDHLI